MKKNLIKLLTLFLITQPHANQILATTKTTPPSEYSKVEKEEKADIYLNFENATLSSVVNYLTNLKNINFIPHKGLEAIKVSLTTREAITLSRAWDILLTLLEMNNFSIIKVGNVYRIVQSQLNKQEPLPVFSSNKGVKPKDLPDNDKIIRYIYILKNIRTEVAQKILDDLLGRGKVMTNRDLATCIITDKSLNIKSAMKIVEELDTGGLREAIKILQLKNTNAIEVAALFTNQIMDRQQIQSPAIRFIGPKEKKEITYFSNTTKIIPEARNNALILLGLEQNIDKVIAFINKYIDVPMDTAKSRIHIKEMKYVEATTIKPIIDKMTKPPQQPAGAKPQTVVGEFKFFEDVIVEAENPQAGKDEESRGSGNRLIISCSKDDWKRLEKLIDKLDKPQPQVALEIMIVDIVGTDIKKLGSQIREKTGKSFAHGFGAITANLQEIKIDETSHKSDYDPNLIKVAASGEAGTTSISIGKTAENENDKGNVWAVLKSVLSSSKSNIISQPFMIARNNKECEIETKLVKKLQGKLNTSTLHSINDYDDVEASTILKITPRINISGQIDLKINIILSEFIGGTGDQQDRSDRAMETRTTIGSGEVLALGGLTKNKTGDTLYKTPILGDVPLLGLFFKNKSQTSEKSNLYVFIRPSIVKPKFEGGPDEYTQLKIDYAKRQIIGAEDIQHSNDPIQRWFFKPSTQSIQQRISDINQGIYRPIDNFVQGRSQPKSVLIEHDPYFRVKEAIKKTPTEKSKAKPDERKLLPSKRKQRLKG